MADCVLLAGVCHTPFLPRRLAAPDLGPRDAAIERSFAAMRARVDASEPDVLVVIGADHLNQLFMDTMPPFLVGKPPRVAGPFPHERAAFGIPPYETAVDAQGARDVVASGFDHGIDLAYADECRLDHAFVVPLHFLRPEQDRPIIPIYINTMAPPVPPAKRFFDVGLALRDVIEDLPSRRRVAVIASGHLSSELGGPRMKVTDAQGRFDAAFDEAAMSVLEEGDVDGLLGLATGERMARAGNVTSGFLAYVMLAGLARGAPATTLESIGHVPFLAWDPAVGR